MMNWCGGTNEDITISISSGAYFNEIPEAIMYDKSIPIIYTQEVELIKEHTDEWEIQKYCSKKKKNHYCKITEQILIALTNISNHAKENEIDISEMYIQPFDNNKRYKRGVQFLGNLYHFCCNVATEKQLRQFYSNEEKLNLQINKFKNIFISDHNDLINITSEIHKYTVRNDNNIDILRTSFTDFINETRSNEKNEKSDRKHAILGLQEIIYKIISILKQFTDYERDTSTHLHCKLHKIPTTIIKPDIIRNDLQKLSATLLKDGYELVIPIHDISAYFNLPITECQFSKTKILIKIKVPIQEHMAEWKLFQYIPIHFKFENLICQIFSEKTYVTINSNNNEHRVISGVGLQHCDPPVTDLCYNPRFSSDIILSPKCVESIFKNKPLEVINQYCYFQCITQNKDKPTIIKEIGINIFAITNPQPTLKIKKEENKKIILTNLNINYNHPGLIKIHLPCNHELIKNTQVIIPKMYPCELSNRNKLKINRVLPISWTNIKTLKFNHEEKNSEVYFTNLTNILNNNWKTDVPNFHINKQNKDPEKYFNDIILSKMPQSFIDDFIGDIIYLTWLTLLTLIMGIICYKLYPIILKVDLLFQPPPIPNKQPDNTNTSNTQN